jgi:predicted anti-sigma-YlaC factor YlaD
MTQSETCQFVAEKLGAYIDRVLCDADCVEIESHLQDCPACREAARRISDVQRLLNGAQRAGKQT